jgi:hypothetical protein
MPFMRWLILPLPCVFFVYILVRRLEKSRGCRWRSLDALVVPFFFLVRADSLALGLWVFDCMRGCVCAQGNRDRTMAMSARAKGKAQMNQRKNKRHGIEVSTKRDGFPALHLDFGWAASGLDAQAGPPVDHETFLSVGRVALCAIRRGTAPFVFCFFLFFFSEKSRRLVAHGRFILMGQKKREID